MATLDVYSVRDMIWIMNKLSVEQTKQLHELVAQAKFHNRTCGGMSTPVFNSYMQRLIAITGIEVANEFVALHGDEVIQEALNRTFGPKPSNN